MKQLLINYANYEHWANDRLLQVILSLDESMHTREAISSFPSVQKTFLHIWDASSIWWQRLQMHEQIVVPSLSFHPNMRDIANGLQYHAKQWSEWITNASPDMINASLPYKNMKGEPFVQPIRDILLHLLNHGTYHRGQAVAQLRQLGITTVPATDYIVFTREN
ncbi:MAG: hypothetical protein GXC72_05275 [Chitinophagaceae bacterium]|nr:hypothetical protein [Chitinophagaceae bacterium]